MWCQYTRVVCLLFWKKFFVQNQEAMCCYCCSMPVTSHCWTKHSPPASTLLSSVIPSFPQLLLSRQWPSYSLTRPGDSSQKVARPVRAGRLAWPIVTPRSITIPYHSVGVGGSSTVIILWIYTRPRHRNVELAPLARSCERELSTSLMAQSSVASVWLFSRRLFTWKNISFVTWSVPQ